MCRIILIIALICLFVYPLSYAEEKKPPETPYRLDDIVVTASKVPLPEESVTQKVNVIHDSEWEHYTYADRNISEILQYQPGTFVNPLSRNDANWGSYGGLGPKYSTYMLDGLPIDSFADGMSLDPWAFDRVEVQRGPASVMYSNYLSQDFAGNETPLAGTSNFILKEKID
jgi:iron complex outermembrane recepter protein